MRAAVRRLPNVASHSAASRGIFALNVPLRSRTLAIARPFSTGTIPSIIFFNLPVLLSSYEPQIAYANLASS